MENKELIPDTRQKKRPTGLTYVKKKGWTAKQLRLQHILANPFDDRTTLEKCKDIKTGETTLARWRKKPGWTDAVHQIAVKAIGNETPKVLKALYDKAESGDVPAIKLFYEMTGWYVERKAIKVIPGELDDYSDEELNQMLAENLKKIRPAEIISIEPKEDIVPVKEKSQNE